MKRRPVDLRIDELVLEGMEGVDGTAVVRAVQTELARLLAEGGLPEGPRPPRRVERVASGTLPDADAGAAAQGARIAQAIYEGVVGRGSSPGAPSSPGEPREGS